MLTASSILRLVLARVAAIFAVIVSVAAKTNVIFTLADAAVALASALLFLGAARQAVVRTGHSEECIAFCARLKEALPVTLVTCFC